MWFHGKKKKNADFTALKKARLVECLTGEFEIFSKNEVRFKMVCQRLPKVQRI